MGQFAVLKARRGARLAVSKCDVRHCYHMIKSTRAWQRMLAHPPPPTGKVRRTLRRERRFLVHCAWPMGFGPSATIAQGIADVCVDRSGAPAHRRVRGRDLPPMELPVFGSMMDDIWGIDELPLEGPSAGGMKASEIVERVAAEWPKIGLEEHPDKTHVAVFGEEVQGLFVHPTDGWIGVSVAKRAKLWAATMRLVSFPRPSLRSVERIVGKLGFCAGSRPCLRACFGDTYRVLQGARDQGRHRVELIDGVIGELMAMATLLPFAQCSVTSEFSEQVICSDASPGGHGFSYATAPPDDVQRWCRMAELRGCYTSLQEDLDMALAPDGQQQVQKVVLPLKALWWHHVGRPGGWSHITLEECRALRWATERRLHSARDLGRRCLHPVDNSSVSGASAKGRSASRALNYEMRKMMSVQILGGLWVFAPWIGSSENPSDWPSSWYGLRAGDVPPAGAFLSLRERAGLRGHSPRFGAAWREWGLACRSAARR